jgi:hypothetical protein
MSPPSLRLPRTRLVALSALVGLSAPALAGSKGDTVRELLGTGEGIDARKKCDRWKALEETADGDLRAACAQAWWSEAERVGSVEAWAEFGRDWAGTPSATQAFEREAQAAAERIGQAAGEAKWAELARTYRGTEAARTLEQGAARAAIRDARTGTDALAVVSRHPDAAGLDELVERFPDDFLEVGVVGRGVQVRVKPDVELKGARAPAVSWVAVAPSGDVSDWDQVMGEALAAEGIPERVLRERQPVGGVGPTLPVCPGKASTDGLRPSVKVAVGSGAVLTVVPWDEACKGGEPPALLTQDGSSIGMWLGPDRSIDLGQGTAKDRWTVAYVVEQPPTLSFIAGGAVYQQAGRAWIAHPVSGGTPWLSGQTPPEPRTPLAGLVGGPLPAGWSVPRAGQISGPGGIYDIPAGNVTALSPLAREVLGLAAAPVRRAAPALDRDVPWVRSGMGLVQRQPPLGGGPAGIYQMTDAEIELATSLLSALGIRRDALAWIDGWRADLDGDKGEESILRLMVDGAGAVAVLDPLSGSTLSSPSDTRAFVWSVPRVLAGDSPAGTPFPFRWSDNVYLAWSGQEVDAAGKVVNFVQVIRSDGTGFTSDDILLP